MGGQAVSADERVLIFATTRPLDLWMAARPAPNAPFAAPVKLPAPIDSAERDSNATLSADGSVLIFESDRPGGLGGSDLLANPPRAEESRRARPLSLGRGWPKAG